jgi:DNA-binding MarR family transcriptional regulator
MSRLKPASAAQKEEAAGLFVHTMPGHYIRRVQQVAVRLFSEGVSGDMTPVQFATLLALDEAPEIGQAALAAMIGYDRATIGGVIDRLQAKGLVQRASDPVDRRSNILTLTEKGIAALNAARPEVEAVQEKLLAPLNPAERIQYETMCRKILSAYGG